MVGATTPSSSRRTLGLAVPTFVIGSAAQELLGVRWQVLPVAGTDDGISGYILPALTLSVAGLSVAVRVMRSEVLSRRNDAHVRTARAKGLSESAITRRHVVRNSLAPFVTFLGLEVGALAGGSIVVERVFNLPGVGGAIARAISQRDNALIVGFTLAVIVVYLAVDLIVDVVSMWLDPRLGSIDVR